MSARCRHAVIALALAFGGITASPAAHSEEFEAEKISNPLLGHAYLTYREGDRFRAMAMLMAADKLKRLGDDRDLARLFLADNFARLGLHEEALAMYTRLARQSVGPQSMRDSAWLEHAKLQLVLGRMDAALQSLTHIKRSLSPAQRVERDSIRARALLEAGKRQEALAALPRINDESSWALYQLFNIGVQLIEHRNKNGALILHQIGRLADSRDREVEAIRDQANLALGYSLLKIGQPDKARGYLEKVRLKSHLSNIALLGMGWSYSSDQNYEQALVFWMELEGRPYRSAYGYETMLAVPYALAKAGAFNQAIEHYQAAQKQIDADTQDMNEAKKKINSDLFPKLISAIPTDETGWLEHWQNTPEAPEQRFLPLLLDNPEFQAALLEYRALIKLGAQLESLESDIGAIEQHQDRSRMDADVAALQRRHQTIGRQIDKARQLQLKQLKQEALRTLSRYQAQLAGHVDQIKFGIAQAIEGGTFELEEGLQ
ncbi:hypothetical protein Tel_14005 [Candidatus Tenderia electrophaga]|jgi:hypothetical protein|uniref:MalT-like TPR region domain-containing protein n=1 Tax=Candidatus Tenderia electrophaga TaxID=1748243 RepID=A0A0S2TG93_9GAMM|nr:hypothetical protein Tel_14005 [Candidatus Tenderia electrophaga]